MKTPAANPHGDPTQCNACHLEAAEEQRPLRFDGNISRLCQSCHDGQRATREVHPVDILPTEVTRQKIPSSFPLDDGRVSCRTCHDVTWGCKNETTNPQTGSHGLRGGQMANPMMFCLQCHAEENYRPFNAHDQRQADKAKVDTCLWCHTSVPDVSARFDNGALHTLRRQSFGVCRSCHRVAKDHPAGGIHMEAIPTLEMRWHMSAYEMQSTMRLSFAQLLKYARATKRIPRSMPLDERGRITCFTCHNPHEKGLLPARNPRSSGAEPKHAVDHRLRIHEDNMCTACHEK